jgi:hypothetical protein
MRFKVPWEAKKSQQGFLEETISVIEISVSHWLPHAYEKKEVFLCVFMLSIMLDGRKLLPQKHSNAEKYGSSH